MSTNKGQSASKKTESKDEKTIKSLKEDKKRLEDRVKILCLEFDFKNVPPEVINQHMKDLYEETIETLKDKLETLEKSNGTNDSKTEKARTETAKNDAMTFRQMEQLQKTLDKANADMSEMKIKNQALTKDNETAKDQIKQLTDELATLKIENNKLTESKNTNDSKHSEKIDELLTKDKISTDLRKDLVKKEEEIAKLNKYLSDKEREIEELQTKDKTSAGLKDELANKEEDIVKLNKALTDVKSDLKKKEQEVKKLGGDLSNAISKIKDLQTQNSKLEKEKAKVDSSNSRSKSANVFRQQLEAANHEIEELKTRLSKVMGANITDNNPDIADLSDLNRPTKLAEKYSELYDNEWTDAFEEIENDGIKEVDAIKRLFDSLKDVYKFCNQVSVNYTKNIKASALLIPGTDNGRPNTANLPATSRKQITELRKAFAPSLAGDVFKQYLKTTKQSLDICPQTKKYFKACIDLCWLMSIQDPPVVLDLGDSSGKFDGDKYKTYTKTGKTLDYVVWPPLRLHEGGALLSRGVAQGK